MSHIATVKTKIKNLKIIEEVCRGLHVPLEIKRQDVRLYAGSVEAVAVIRLPGWRYPVAVEPSGAIKFDNYSGLWGAQNELHRVLRAYAERVTVSQARRMGMTVRRQEQPDGAIVLRLG